MVRSARKAPFVAYHLLEKVRSLNETGQYRTITTWSRSSIIVPSIIGHQISVHTGQAHLTVLITDQIVGHKLGEFIPTRTFRGHVKLDKKTKRLFLFLWDKRLALWVFV